jgi:hypothetical protein
MCLLFLVFLGLNGNTLVVWRKVSSRQSASEQDDNWGICYLALDRFVVGPCKHREPDAIRPAEDEGVEGADT